MPQASISGKRGGGVGPIRSSRGGNPSPKPRTPSPCRTPHCPLFLKKIIKNSKMTGPIEVFKSQRHRVLNGGGEGRGRGWSWTPPLGSGFPLPRYIPAQKGPKKKSEFSKKMSKRCFQCFSQQIGKPCKKKQFLLIIDFY